jgi:hypothetical protein
MKLLCIKPDIVTGWWPVRLSVHAAEILGRNDRGSLQPVLCLTEASYDGTHASTTNFRKMLPPPLGAPLPPGRFESHHRGEFFEGVLEATDDELQILWGGGYRLSDLRKVSLADFLSVSFAQCSRCGSRSYWRDNRDDTWHCMSCERRLPSPDSVRSI